MNDYLCKICGEIKQSSASLYIHIYQKHKMHKKEYYDTYLKTTGDGICPICGSVVKWCTSKGSYYKYCNLMCAGNDPEKKARRSITIKTRANAVRPSDSEIETIKLKILQSNIPLDKTICLICGQKFKNYKGMGKHSLFKHLIDSKEYYDLFYKKPGEGICKTCGKGGLWNKSKGKYKIYCNSKCFGLDKDQIHEREQTCLKKYGTTNISAIPERIEKVKQTCLVRYGHECPMHSKDIRIKMTQNWVSKYGVDHPSKSKEVHDKIKNTTFEHYGVYASFNSPIVRQKSRDTMNKRYGVSYAMQNPESFELQQKNCYKTKEYILPSGKIIHKQGFEPQFLDYIFKNKLLDENDIIYNPKGIKYINKVGSSSYYYPDFYIPRLNLIVEIKSSYTVVLDKNIELKKNACISAGYNYIRIINNIFTELDEVLKKINI